MRRSVKAPGKFLLSLSPRQNAGIGAGMQRLVWEPRMVAPKGTPCVAPAKSRLWLVVPGECRTPWLVRS